MTKDESDDESREESDLTYFAIKDLESVEEALTETEFLHVMIVSTKKESMVAGPHMSFARGEAGKFDGVAIEICCNKKSVMSLAKYYTYCSGIGPKKAVNSATRTVVESIGAKQVPMGTAKKPSPIREAETHFRRTIPHPNEECLIPSKHEINGDKQARHEHTGFLHLFCWRQVGAHDGEPLSYPQMAPK